MGMITDIDEALDRLKSFPPCRTKFTVDDDDWISAILDATTGTTPDSKVVYRVYYAAAEALKLAGSTKQVKKLDSYLEGSAEYFQDTQNINFFLEMQAKEDAALGLTVGVYSSADISGNFVAGRQAWMTDKEQIYSRAPEYLEDRYIQRSGSGTRRGGLF